MQNVNLLAESDKNNCKTNEDDDISSECPETAANETANKLANRLIAEICDFGLYKDEQLLSYLNSKYNQIMKHPKLLNNSIMTQKFNRVFQDICDEFQVQFEKLHIINQTNTNIEQQTTQKFDHKSKLQEKLEDTH